MNYFLEWSSSNEENICLTCTLLSQTSHKTLKSSYGNTIGLELRLYVQFKNIFNIMIMKLHFFNECFGTSLCLGSDVQSES